MYIIGITQFLYLIYPITNPLSFDILDSKPGPGPEYFCIKHSGAAIMSLSYGREVTCTLLKLNEYIKDQLGRYPSIDELFEKLDRLKFGKRRTLDQQARITNETRKIYSMIGEEVLDMIPTRYHIWDFLFGDVVFDQITLPEYVNTLSSTFEMFAERKYYSERGITDIYTDILEKCEIPKKTLGFNMAEVDFDKFDI